MRGLIELMSTHRLITFKKTHFDFFFGFLYRIMFRVVDSIWVFLSKFISSFFRFPTNRYLEDLDSNFGEFSGRYINDHADQGNREGESFAMMASSTKYEFLYSKGITISGFIEEPYTKSFTVHEFYTVSNDYVNLNGVFESSDSIGSFVVEKAAEETEKPVEEKTEEPNAVFEDKTEESALRFSFVKSFEFEKQIKAIKQEHLVEDYIGSSIVEGTIEKPEQDIKNVANGKTEDSVENFIAEIETEDIFKEKAEESVKNYITENILNKEVDDIESNHQVAENFGDFFESTAIDRYLKKWHQENMEHEIHECDTSFSDHEEAIFEESINDFEDKFIEYEQRSEKLSVIGETQPVEDLSNETESMVSPGKPKEPNLQEDEDSEFESEHDDLIERLKMEVKVARNRGLATILEDFESPKMVQELRPLQIDEKHDHNYHIVEIQKVYKSYSAKMRKLDMLSSQTMHAISLLQLKNVPVQLSTSGKSSASAVKSLQKVLSFKQRKAKADPSMKLIRDLHKDFETVYVGQIYLSWAILNWQFRKVNKLLECDTLGIHHYNQVSGEFQHFQVLLQRFLEDEPFQTRPRVENYANSRCLVRHLLQVPVIKDEKQKYKEDAVSSEMLKGIIEESKHVFWDFLRADKGESSSTSKATLQSQVAPHDPIDFELLMDVRTDLQKKEKRLKEIQKGTNCIIKKFQRQQQQQHRGNLLDHALFIAQVELKLVSRVLNMLKINTDQLVWCHDKLQRINFSSRKIEIDPSFTLFPC